MEEMWYRVKEKRYATPVDEFGNPIDGSTRGVLLEKFNVLKHTPKGVRLSNGRFVLRDAMKRYACPTIVEAYESFFARKSKHRRILLKNLDDIDFYVREAQRQLHLLEKLNATN